MSSYITEISRQKWQRSVERDKVLEQQDPQAFKAKHEQHKDAYDEISKLETTGSVLNTTSNGLYLGAAGCGIYAAVTNDPIMACVALVLAVAAYLVSNLADFAKNSAAAVGNEKILNREEGIELSSPSPR